MDIRTLSKKLKLSITTLPEPWGVRVKLALLAVVILPVLNVTSPEAPNVPTVVLPADNVPVVLRLSLPKLIAPVVSVIVAALIVVVSTTKEPPVIEPVVLIFSSPKLIEPPLSAVSYTHLTLPTILLV